MPLNACKKETIELCRKKGWDTVSVENLWMFLIEEVGELASAIRRSTNRFNDRKKNKYRRRDYGCPKLSFSNRSFVRHRPRCCLESTQRAGNCV